MKIVLYIGLDVHKDSISIAVAESGRDGKVYSYGKISNSLHAVDKLIARLRKQYGKDVRLSFCYEAGPCGFVLVRRLLQLGHDCIVVAPSKIARKPGDKVKTDKRDADHRGSGEPGGAAEGSRKAVRRVGASESKAGQSPPGRISRCHLHPGSHRRSDPRSLPRSHGCRR